MANLYGYSLSKIYFEHCLLPWDSALWLQRPYNLPRNIVQTQKPKCGLKVLTASQLQFSPYWLFIWQELDLDFSPLKLKILVELKTVFKTLVDTRNENKQISPASCSPSCPVPTFRQMFNMYQCMHTIRNN